MKNKPFKCFTLLNQATLLIAYNEWSAEYFDKWQQNEDNGLWILMERQPLKLTVNEFIGNISVTNEDDSSNLAMTIYNDLTEQWRMEVQNVDTLICLKRILLPGTSIIHDYRLTPIRNAESDIKWLIYSPANTNIVAIDSKWKKTQLNYRHSVQRIALFKENFLIVRTTERIDIHSFL
jgi:hypothetical protein